jgi:chromosome partitioning protein
MAKRIAVVNFKGGVGKTTLALHLGCYLARRDPDGGEEARVLLIDVDHQSSLSIVSQNEDHWETACRNGKTVNKIFSSYTTQGAPFPGQEIIVKTPFGSSYPTLDIVPAQFELDDTEIDLAATNIGTAYVSEWRKRTLLCKWLSDSGADEQYDFVIFDCPPATKIVSQNAIAASHAYVVPVIPDAMSTRGVTHFVNLVQNRIDAKLKGFAAVVSPNEIPKSYVPSTMLGGIVISMAQTHGPSLTGYLNEHSNQMSALRRQWGLAVLQNVVERATGVAESLGAGWPVFDRSDDINVRNRLLPAMFRRVCEELVVTRLAW